SSILLCFFVSTVPLGFRQPLFETLDVAVWNTSRYSPPATHDRYAVIRLYPCPSGRGFTRVLLSCFFSTQHNCQHPSPESKIPALCRYF
ncbi:hypothetical protein, partial [Marinospirillum sp.]|uniref:hypothetical protein n=1 Tax=Marinospirillum sp. TaxID=2183934 RepID=UPI0025B87EFB